MEFWIIFYEILFQNFIEEINCLVVYVNLFYDFQYFKLFFYNNSIIFFLILLIFNSKNKK